MKHEPETEFETIETEAEFLEKVRHRAYSLWQRDGESHGRDQDFWYLAEKEIADEEGRPAPSDPQFPPVVAA